MLHWVGAEGVEHVVVVVVDVGGSRSKLLTVLSNVRCIVTDLGTEKGLSNARLVWYSGQIAGVK